MGKKKAAEAGSVETASVESPASTEAPRELGSEETAGKVSQSSAVRQALTEGLDTNADIIDFCSRRFGLDVSKNVSALKSVEKKKLASGEGTGKRGRPRGSAKAPAPSGGSDALAAAKAVKELVDRYGAETVKGFAELFGN